MTAKMRLGHASSVKTSKFYPYCRRSFWTRISFTPVCARPAFCFDTRPEKNETLTYLSYQ